MQDVGCLPRFLKTAASSVAPLDTIEMNDLVVWGKCYHGPRKFRPYIWNDLTENCWRNVAGLPGTELKTEEWSGQHLAFHICHRQPAAEREGEREWSESYNNVTPRLNCSTCACRRRREGVRSKEQQTPSDARSVRAISRVS